MRSLLGLDPDTSVVSGSLFDRCELPDICRCRFVNEGREEMYEDSQAAGSDDRAIGLVSSGTWRSEVSTLKQVTNKPPCHRSVDVA